MLLNNALSIKNNGLEVICFNDLHSVEEWGCIAIFIRVVSKSYPTFFHFFHPAMFDPEHNLRETGHR